MAHLTHEACFWKTYIKRADQILTRTTHSGGLAQNLAQAQRVFQQYQKGRTIFCEISAEKCYISVLVQFIDLTSIASFQSQLSFFPVIMLGTIRKYSSVLG